MIIHYGLDGIGLDGDRGHHHRVGHPAGLARGQAGHLAYHLCGHHAGHLCMLCDDFRVFYRVDCYNIFGYFGMKIRLH